MENLTSVSEKEFYQGTDPKAGNRKYEYYGSGLHSGIPGNVLEGFSYTGITNTNGVGIFL